MSSKEQFIKLPREVLESVSFGSLGINGFRVLRFLMIEHMRCGGRENGELKAPHRHLAQFGIAPRHVAAAIQNVEESRLVTCHRHGLRVANKYELTWLPLHDGSAPSDAWRGYEPPKKSAYHRVRRRRAHLPAESEAVSLPAQREVGLPTQSEADRPNLPTQRKTEPSQNLPTLRKALSRIGSCQAVNGVKEVEGYSSTIPDGAVAAEAVRVATSPSPGKPIADAGVAEPDLDPTRFCGSYVVGNAGHRLCGKPVIVGTDRCSDHALRVVGAR